MLAATDPRLWDGAAGFAFAATPAAATPPAVAAVRATVRATRCHFLMGISFGATSCGNCRGGTHRTVMDGTGISRARLGPWPRRYPDRAAGPRRSSQDRKSTRLN